MKTKSMSSKIYIALILLFIYIPIISLIVFSFNEGRSLVIFTGFSFKWYADLFQNEQLIQAIVTTFVVAIISTIISTIIGTFAALMLSKQKKVVRELTLSVNNIPIISPEIITAIALFIFFGSFAIQRGFITMILAHIAFSIPYVLLAVYPKVRSLDGDILDAAYDLGATPAKALRKVIIPQIMPAILAGAAIAFTMSFDDFVISYFATSGSTVQNISIYLYTLKRGIEPSVNALSAIMILVIGIKMAYDYFKSSKKREEV